MKIFLRILIVILLILSGVALFLAIVLFGQREEIKARLDRTENVIYKLSKFIERVQVDDLETRTLDVGGFEIPEIKRYYRIGPDGKRVKSPQTQMYITSGPGTMTEPLDALIENAEKMYKRLDETRDELRKRREKIEDLQKNITGLRSDIAKLYERIDIKDDELAQAREQAASLQTIIENKDEEITSLKATIDEQNTKMARLEDKIQQLQNDNTVLHKKAQDLQHQLIQLQQVMGHAGIAIQLSPGTQGEVLKVNPEWNFIVFAIPEDSKLQIGVELLVRRETKFIGKVRVTRVTLEEKVAVADIVEIWTQTPIQKGDIVDYVRQ